MVRLSVEPVVCHVASCKCCLCIDPGVDSQQQPVEADSRVQQQCCVARGVLQAEALLDGVTRDWTAKLDLQTEVPLFSKQGIRIGLQDPAIAAKQV